MSRVIVFSHDHKFIRYNGRYFTKASFNDEVLSRYIVYGGCLKIICRLVDVADYPDGCSEIKNQNILFFPLVNMRSVKGLFFVFINLLKTKKILMDASLVFVRLPSSVGLLTYIAAGFLKKKIIVEVVGNALESNKLHGSGLGKVFGVVEHYFTKKFIASASNVIYITEHYLQSIYPNLKNTVVLPNVSITPLGNILQKKTEFDQVIRTRLIGSSDVNHKGHDTALKTTAELKRKLPKYDFQLIFIGAGDARRWDELIFKLSLEQNVFFQGAVKAGKSVFDLVMTMDFMLQPSTVEAQGRSIIESMNCGVPVIATKVGGIPELISGDFLIDVNDYVRAAEIIKYFILDVSAYNDFRNDNLIKSMFFYNDRINSNRMDYVNAILSKEDI